MNINLEQSSIESNINNFTRVIDSAINILRNERLTGHIRGGKINLGLVKLQVPENLVIIGDLHGDLKSLFKILDDIDFERFLDNPNNKIIFLGDYVDRGTHSISVLYTVCYLKQRFPNSVIPMRGNHEATMEFPFLSHSLPSEVEEYFGEGGREIYKKILLFFQQLPLVTIIQNQLLLVHGGLPTTLRYADFHKLIVNAQHNQGPSTVLEEILWNDPRSDIQNGQTWEKSRRSFGKHFSKDISKKWLEATKTKVIVRGHEPCHGFKIDHENMVLTIFSCKEAYTKFDAAYIVVTGRQLQMISNASDLTQYVRKLNS